jgi:hypothetical protein
MLSRYFVSPLAASTKVSITRRYAGKWQRPSYADAESEGKRVTGIARVGTCVRIAHRDATILLC